MIVSIKQILIFNGYGRLYHAEYDRMHQMTALKSILFLILAPAWSQDTFRLPGFEADLRNQADCRCQL